MMNFKNIIWLLFFGTGVITAGAQNLCPIEWVNQIAQFEDTTPIAFVRTVQPGLPYSTTNPVYFRSQLQTDALANVFRHDPRDPSSVEVVLPGLIGDGTRLEGTYVRAGSERLDGFFEAASSADGADFRFLPDTTVALPCNTVISECSRFDAVNAYYHVDQFARKFWVEQLGVNIDFQVDVKVHVGGDGAFATAPENVLKFRLGDIFMKNAALSDDIIYHEYAHLVAARLGFFPTSIQSDQTRALSEGYADYFTATYTNDPQIGEWVVTCPDRQNCVGPANDKELRSLVLDSDIWNWKFGFPSSDLEYGFCLRYHTGDGKCKASYNNFANRYVWGMIWSAAWWDLRIQLGPQIVDQLALKAVQNHTLETDFTDAVEHILWADQVFFSGQYNAVIRDTFRSRGFVLPLVQALDTPAEIPAFNFSIWPNPTSHTVEVKFDTQTTSTLTIAWYDLLGREIKNQKITPDHIGTQQVTLSTESLPSGVYMLTMEVGNKRESRQLTVIR